MRKHRQRWPLFVVATAATFLVVARALWPTLNFDSTSLILFGIAALAFFMAYVPLKKFKWGDFEAELDEAVDNLERKVGASEERSRQASPPPAPSASQPSTTSPEGAAIAFRAAQTWEQYFDEYARLVSSPVSNVEKIVGAAIVLERMLATLTEAFELKLDHKGRSPRAIVDRLAKEGLFDQDERAAIHEFWTIRNKVVHDGLMPTDEQTARILDLVWRLVRTFA